MRRRLTILSAIVVVLAVALAATHLRSADGEPAARPARGDSAAKCRKPGRSIQLRGSQALVFTRRSLEYACVYRTGRVISLDNRVSGTYAFPPPAIALAGTILAFAADVESTDLSIETIVSVTDISKPGGQGAKVAAPAGQAGIAKVGSVKVNLRGSVAWIACPAPEGSRAVGDPRPTCLRPGADDEVWKYEIGEQNSELLDSGVGIDPRSLRRHGGTISWQHGEETKTASLR
jgi:hypothetical protein